MVDLCLQTQTDVTVDAVGPAAFRIRVGRGRRGQSSLERYRLVTMPSFPAAVEEAGSIVWVRGATACLGVDVSTSEVVLTDLAGTELTRGVIPESGMATALSVSLGDDDRVFGLGDASRESIDRRGCVIETWVRNVTSYAPVPFVVSTGGWGLYVNTTQQVRFDVAASTPGQLAVDGADVGDIVLFAGDIGDVLRQFSALVGRPALLPRWAYGLMFVCNEQNDARAVLDDAREFRNRGIPCDAVGLEPGWMATNYDYSVDKQWHPDRFYLPPWMIEPDADGRRPGLVHTFLGALDRLEYRLSLWLCCDYDLSYEAERRALRPVGTAAMDDNTPVLDAADVERDRRLQRPVLMDKLTRPEEPWFEHLKPFVDLGASAFKLDGANQVMVHPDRAWANGMADAEMHNLYPALLSQQMAEGFAEHTGRRPMVYSACGYTGSARYAATWAGDTGGGAGPLVSLINHGLSGHSNTSCDMDVFTVEGIHFGFLQPWSQLSSWAYWRQPWYLGTELEKVFRDYATLRQRLVPYLYSMAHVAHLTGIPVLRGMPLAAPGLEIDDGRARHQYLLGDALLVGAFTSQVVLPAGEWTDFWTGATVVGGVVTDAGLPAGRGGPLFARAGSIIPLAPTGTPAGVVPETIEWLVHPGADGTFTLYEDDGLSLAHDAGAVATTSARTTTRPGQVTVTIEARTGTYDGMATRRDHRVRLRLAEVVGVTVDGTPVPYECTDGLVSVAVVDAADRRTTITVDVPA